MFTLMVTRIACHYSYARSQHKTVFSLPLRPAVTVLTVYWNSEKLDEFMRKFLGLAVTCAKEVPTAGGTLCR